MPFQNAISHQVLIFPILGIVVLIGILEIILHALFCCLFSFVKWVGLVELQSDTA